MYINKKEGWRRLRGGSFSIGADWWRFIGGRVKSPGLGVWVRHGQADDARQPAGQTLLHNTFPSKTTRLLSPTTAAYRLPPKSACRVIHDSTVLHRPPLLPRHHTSRHVPHLPARPSLFAIVRICSSIVHLFNIHKRHYTYHLTTCPAGGWVAGLAATRLPRKMPQRRPFYS
jgi:hypothetical protein